MFGQLVTTSVERIQKVILVFSQKTNLACHVRYTIFCDDAILFYSNVHLGDDHHGHFWSKHVTKAFLFLKLVDFWLNCFPQFSFSLMN